MRTIINKEGEIKGIKSSYFDLIKMSLDSHPTGKGWVVTEMKKALRIISLIDKLKEGEKEIKIEEQDFFFLQETFEATPWKVSSQLIIDLDDYLKEIKPDK